MKPEIIYIDNHLLVVNKPAGMLVQGDKTGDISLLDICKEFIKEKYNKPGNVFLGLMHRLDRPVSGVIVLARTSKAASRLTDQFRKRLPEKKYYALVHGLVPQEDKYSDMILRKDVKSVITKKKNGKLAKLSFKLLKYLDKISMVEVKLETGRHHQIRVQFSHRGFPLLGDFRYGSNSTLPDKSIALHAHSLKIIHPTKKEEMTFTADLPNFWPAPFRK